MTISLSKKKADDFSPLADKLIWLIGAAYFLFFSYLSHFLYNNLLYIDQDLAIHAQTMWNLVHGSGFCSILGIDFFGNHFIPIFYLLKYFYYFYQSPLFLLYLQSFALGVGGILTYKLARHYLSGGWSLLVAAAYYLYPSVGYTNAYEFHQTTLAVPFLFLMILYYLRARFFFFLVYAILAMSLQENIPLAVFMMSALALLDRRKMHWIIVPAALSVLWFYVSVIKIIPFYNKGTIEFLSIYYHLGRTWPEIILTLIARPFVWLEQVFSLQAFSYLAHVFLPLLLLPLLGWRFCLPILPFLFQHLLSSRAAERAITFHYLTELTPFLMMATILGVVAVKNRYKEKLVHYGLVFCFLASFLITAILISPYSVWLDRIERFSKSQLLEFKRASLSQIPKDAPVVASLQFLSSLSQRRELYSFHHVYMGTYTLSKREYVLPESVQYALLDMNDTTTFGFANPNSPENLKVFFRDTAWQVIDFAQDTLLLKKGKRDLDPLYTVHEEDPGPPEISLKASVNEEIELKGINLRMGEASHETHVGLSFHWKALKKPSRDYAMLITIVNARGGTIYKYHRNICYRLYPTKDWNAGETVVENYWFIMPPNLPRQNIEVRLSLVDQDKKELQIFKGELKEKIDGYGRVLLDTFEPY